MRLRDIGRYVVPLAQVAAHRLRHGDEPFFTRGDWMSGHREHLMAALGEFLHRPAEILEVGSFEGRSALFFLATFPQARLTCVDLFTPRLSAKFGNNVGRYRDRVTKLRGRSAAVLDRLAAEKRRYDVIYIDGGHRRAEVIADSVLAWELLNVGGVLIWDDYLWKTDRPSAARPQHAIDLFCHAFAPCLRELHRDYQVIVTKTGDWPIPPAAPTCSMTA
jgi:predicted O-methyltransferase YrrM